MLYVQSITHESKSTLKAVHQKTVMSSVRKTYILFWMILLEIFFLHSVKMQLIQTVDGKIGRYGVDLFIII